MLNSNSPLLQSMQTGDPDLFFGGRRTPATVTGGWISVGNMPGAQPHKEPRQVILIPF